MYKCTDFCKRRWGNALETGKIVKFSDIEKIAKRCDRVGSEKVIAWLNKCLIRLGFAICLCNIHLNIIQSAEYYLSHCTTISVAWGSAVCAQHSYRPFLWHSGCVFVYSEAYSEVMKKFTKAPRISPVLHTFPALIRWAMFM